MGNDWIKKIPREQLESMYLKEVEKGNTARAELQWVHHIMSNTSASGDEKQATYWLRYRMKRKEPREDGLFHVYNTDIAKDSGLDDKKVGKIFKSLQERGLAKRRLEKKPDEKTGQLKTFNWMALDQSVLDNPRAIDFGKNEKWGGKREKSDKPNACGCGCSDRVVTRRVVCAGCGTVLDETEKRLGENDDLETDEEVF
jgi:hypothetical protein